MPQPAHEFTQRKIIHVDMDAFFASVEQRDFPELRGKPVVVGGSSKRGVIAAASYEARKYGVRSAMPSALAIQKCPHLIFAKGRFDAYKEASQEIRTIFLEYTDLVEPLSLDEAYLDVTENNFSNPSATLIAREIKQKIQQRIHLSSSAGVSYNKFLAKVASGYQKPNGLTVIKPDQALDFIAQLPIAKFHGVGIKTAAKMEEAGIHTGLDLRAWSLEGLLMRFGKAGKYYYHISRGEDRRIVTPSRERKSIGAERTFFDDLITDHEIIHELERISLVLAERMEKSNAKGKTFTLKYRHHDFTTYTRSLTVAAPISTQQQLFAVAQKIFVEEKLTDFKIRLLGMSISNLTKRYPPEGTQLVLFD